MSVRATQGSPLQFRGGAGGLVALRYNRFACEIQFYLQNIVSGAVFVNGVGGCHYKIRDAAGDPVARPYSG